MAEQKESSVLFSLKELMSLEEDRIKQEEDARKRAEDAALQARQAEEAKQRAEEEARMRATEEKRRQEEQRNREEQARVDAIKHAEVERARLEAENRARMETLARQQAHEKEIHALSQDKSKKNLKLIIGLVIGALFLVGGGAGVLIYNANLKQQQLQAQLNDLNAQIDANNKKMNDLNRDLADATDPAKKAEIEKKMADLQAANQKLQTDMASKGGNTPKFTGGGPVVQPNTPKTPQCHMLDGTKVAKCAPGDSLCSCD
jgi:colicin import membrane protein